MRRYLLPCFLVISDVLVLSIIAFFSLYLRFDSITNNGYFFRVFGMLPALAACYIVAMEFFKLYTRVWRYAGTREVMAVIKAMTCGTVLFYIICMAANVSLPRSYFLIVYIIAIGAVGLGRLLLHYIVLVSDRQHIDKDDKVPVLLIGAGDAGATVAKEIIYYHDQKWSLVGFVDDDIEKAGHFLYGRPVMGTRSDIPAIVMDKQIKEIIIAMPSVNPAVISDILSICTPLKCKINILPGIYQILDHKISISRLRPVSIEDLLQRDQIRLDTEKITAFLSGKRVLVSGAGGSIGSEICRQIMRMHPAKLILLGHGENSIYLIHRELSKIYGSSQLVPVIASVRDAMQLDYVFTKYHPQVVFHAAAHKHVPLMEYQPMAAVLNNVYGTHNIAEAAGKYKAEKFVMISTDKAVNPTSAMGATKRVAEKIVQVMNSRYKTQYVTVRFGNVLGSRGSVVPLFRRQLASGGPLTVTDENMTRYFMTIPEASQLVLQAGSMGNGGELFLLDMGEPVKIMDLAKNIIRLSGLEPGKDIQIKIVGLRPGEKLYEELLTAKEGTSKTSHEKIFTAKLDPVNEIWLENKIASFTNCTTDQDVIKVLMDIIPTYQPNRRFDSAGQLQKEIVQCESKEVLT